MKTLKELKDKCTLIAEFRNPAWIGESKKSYRYDKANTCSIYYNNKDTYYLYKHIQTPIIREYTNLNNVRDAFTRFVEYMVM